MTVTAEQLREAQAELKRASRATVEKRAARDVLIRQALAGDWNPSEIARALEITQSAVWQIIHGRVGA